MARQLLYLHWKTVRWGLLPFVVAAFALPVIAVQALGGGGSIPATFYIHQIFTVGATWNPLFPLLAAGTGATLALSAWSWDHHGQHVYALSLPLPRWRYAGLKFGAGALLALIPTAGLAGGAYLSVASLSIPTGLHGYPGALTLRFLAAVLTAYGIVFALAAGTIRTAVIVLTAVILTPLLGDVVVTFAGDFVPALQGVHFTSWLADAVSRWPSPLQIFTGNWFLIDV